MPTLRCRPHRRHTVATARIAGLPPSSGFRRNELLHEKHCVYCGPPRQLTAFERCFVASLLRYFAASLRRGVLARYCATSLLRCFATSLLRHCAVATIGTRCKRGRCHMSRAVATVCVGEWAGWGGGRVCGCVGGWGCWWWELTTVRLGCVPPSPHTLARPTHPCRLGVAGALHVRRVLCVCEEGRSAQHGGRAQLPA